MSVLLFLGRDRRVICRFTRRGRLCLFLRLRGSKARRTAALGDRQPVPGLVFLVLGGGIATSAKPTTTTAAANPTKILRLGTTA